MSNATLTHRCLHGLALVTLRRPDFWERSWKHRLARLMLYAAACYLGIIVCLLLLEDRLLYGPRHVELHIPPAGVEVENVEMTSRTGDRIHAWWTQPKDWRPERGAVIFCHGNSFNLSLRGRALPHWLDEVGLAVMLFDYPGFGRSSGVPGEEACYAAGDASYDYVVEQKKVPPERIVLYGGSLGGGTATELASRRPHRALVLVASFTSFPDMAELRFPWLPGRWLVRNRFDNLSKIARCRGPVFIAHGTRDGLIPFEMGRRLFDAAPEPKRFLTMTGFGHNDLPPDAFYPALRDFLAECDTAAN